MTNKISLVNNSKSTAGCLHLLRILLHHVIVVAANTNNSSFLQEALTYTSRESSPSSSENPAGHMLVDSLMDFVSCTHAFTLSMRKKLEQVPEFFDALTKSMELLLITMSSQLYQPLVSSTQRREMLKHNIDNQANSLFDNFMLRYILERAQERRQQQKQEFLHPRDDHNKGFDVVTPLLDSPSAKNTDQWTPRTVLQTCLGWQIRRPKAPPRSICHYVSQLAQSVATVKGDRPGPDGMYETHMVVTAAHEQKQHDPSDKDDKSNRKTSGKNGTISTPTRTTLRRSSSKALIDATRGVLILSSNIFLLPFRLMTLALSLIRHGRNNNSKNTEQARRENIMKSQAARRVNQVLWLSDSPVADLSTSILLLLTHNYRTGKNPFDAELSALHDNRWEEVSLQVVSSATSSATTNTTSTTTEEHPLTEEQEPSLEKPLLDRQNSRMQLMTNFESMFESFGYTAHTELGALMLYTMHQSSPFFAQSIAVRSDLDTLIVPLLRTLYFSSSLKYYATSGGGPSRNPNDNGSKSPLRLHNCPFRSSSQLYVILILLLLFSQDTSFGPDAFRRVNISQVLWYRERNLRNITLGSLLLLTLLRAITFNLNRLEDAFLLSNCCAVLMNLSPHVVQLHEYAAMRLVAVTVTSLKKFALLLDRNKGPNSKVVNEDDLTSPLGMYGEVSRTLLGLLRHSLSPKNIEKNTKLVYALVYHQRDFKSVFAKECLVRHQQQRAELQRIQQVIEMADKLISENGDARTAVKALHVLEEQMEVLKQEVIHGSGEDLEADFMFSYEEEADPEIFFLPYIWEVIVCCVTSSSLEWDINQIKVFSLLEEEDDKQHDEDQGDVNEMTGFARDVSDVV